VNRSEDQLFADECVRGYTSALNSHLSKIATGGAACFVVVSQPSTKPNLLDAKNGGARLRPNMVRFDTIKLLNPSR
jgi:hypothetical protein